MSGERRTRREPPKEQTALADENVERDVIGHFLANPDRVWDFVDSLSAEHFSHPRLGRIWAAMVRIAKLSKRVTKTLVALHIQGDQGAETPIKLFVEILMQEAIDAHNPVDLETYVGMLLQLAGKRALIDALGEAIAKVKTADISKTIEDIVDESLSTIMGVATGNDDRHIRTNAQVAEKLIDDINEDLKAGPEGQSRGLSPGLRGVEEVIGPLLPGKVYVVGGMSSAGKTSLTSGIMEAAALDAKSKGLGPGYQASMEMSGREHAARSLAAALGLSSFKLERSQVNDGEFDMLITKGLAHMRRFPIFIDTKPRLSLEDIRTRMLTQKHKHGLSFAVIDHLLLVRFGPKVSLSDRVMESVIEAKLMANEMEIPIILLSQVDEKKIMDRKSLEPIASDLFGGQAIQQNADSTAFIHRPEIPLRRRGPDGQGAEARSNHDARLEALKGKAFFYSDKGRGHGSGIRRELIFDGPTISFKDV